MLTEIGFDGYKANSRPVIARQKVRFVGEHVAVILAESEYIARDAIELIEVDYEALPAAARLETAFGDDAPLVHDHIDKNIMFRAAFSTDNFEAEFASTGLVIKKRFRNGRVAGTPLEQRGGLEVRAQVRQK